MNHQRGTDFTCQSLFTGVGDYNCMCTCKKKKGLLQVQGDMFNVSVLNSLKRRAFLTLSQCQSALPLKFENERNPRV